MNLTLLASPRVAAATARHRSTSSPDQLPLPSASAKPARPVCTPQATAPRCLMPSSVLPAWAGAAASVRRAAIDASARRRRAGRSEERRVGKSVDLGGRRIIKKKKRKEEVAAREEEERQTDDA